MTPELEAGKEKILACAQRLVTLQNENGINVVMEEVIGNLKFGLIEVVYEWARGMVRRKSCISIYLLERSSHITHFLYVDFQAYYGSDGRA